MVGLIVREVVHRHAGCGSTRQRDEVDGQLRGRGRWRSHLRCTTAHCQKGQNKEYSSSHRSSASIPTALESKTGSGTLICQARPVIDSWYLAPTLCMRHPTG